MKSQLDAIAPREIVTSAIELSGGGTVRVRGLSSRDWLMLRRRYPLLKDAVFLASLGTDQLYEQAEVVLDAMPAVIACGLGEAGSDKAERLAAERLTDGDRMKLFTAIMELTGGTEAPQPARPLPNGAGQEPSLIEPLIERTTTSPPPSGN